MRFLIFLGLFWLGSLPVFAAEYTIVAEVNGDKISNYELDNRVTLIAKTSNLPDTPEVKEQIRRQALKGMINELLQRQYAEKTGINVTPQDLSLAISSLEQQNNIQAGKFDQFISSQNVSKKAVIEQLRSQILWQKIISKEIAPQVQVREDEISDALQQVAADTMKREVELYEIVLPIDDGDISETSEFANQLVRQLRDGADFAELAKEFSESPTAEDGGYLGRLDQDQLRGALQERVKRAAANTILNPIRAEDSFRIIKLGEVREIGEPQTEQKLTQFLKLRKVEKEAQRLMNQLRRDAFIDIRL